MTASQSLDAIDVAVFRLLNGAGPVTALDSLMLVLSNQWSIVLLLPFFVVQVRAAVTTWRRVLLAGAIAVALLGVVDGGATVLKQRINRPRPCQVLTDVRAVAPCSGSPSLPSNHAANLFALAAFTVACTRRRALLWVGLAVAVGYSRVRLGVHYPFDVLAGAVWGGVLGWAAGVATRRLLTTAATAPASPQLCAEDA